MRELRKFLKNIHYKVLAVLLAFLLWFIAAKKETVTATLKLPVRLKVPKGYFVEKFSPRRITLEVEGSRTAVEILKTEDFVKLKVPKIFIKLGKNKIKIKRAFLSVQAPVKIKNFSPRYLKIDVKKLEWRFVPVKVKVIGRGYVANVEPNYVLIFIPSGADISQVETQPINMAQLRNLPAVLYVPLSSEFRTYPKYVKVEVRK